MAIWEVVAPRRELRIPKRDRWVSNLSLVVLNTLILRLLFPGAALGAAVVAEERGWGLLQRMDFPSAIAITAGVIALDLAVYLQHLVFHAAPTLWRLHLVHHADLDFDVTTGLRFHPVEMVLSMVLKFSVVAALGPPALAVLVFELLLNASAMFNHGNVRIAGLVDRLLRCVLVTPDMHRVHHSALRQETNSNFGFCLSWWDRLFGTYRAEPTAGHEGMTVGVAHLQALRRQTLGTLLVLPLRATGGQYSFNEEGAKRSSAP
jgi:sterol desaturase/sphingolipid hydroxylase (fatty acid hydroxylase superfamily)